MTDFEHTIIPIRYYVYTYISLLILSAATVGVYYLDFGHLNLPLALAIASLKAGIVIMIFMGLKWDKGFDRVVFFSSIVFILIFLVFTLADTFSRGIANTEEKGSFGIKSPVKIIESGAGRQSAGH